MLHKPVMSPAPGERMVRFVGDKLHFTLQGGHGHPLPPGVNARLRTNLGRAATIRREVIESYAGRIPLAGASWRDIPFDHTNDGWVIDLALTEVGFFWAKAYAIDAEGRQYWPDGADVGISVHPCAYRTANTIYCAFPRMFGAGKSATTTSIHALNDQLAPLDQQGFSVIPPSGKLRDLIRQLPHIIDTLGCRILHLLPVNPTPTTYARFGRYGSPYAAGDLTAIDLALVEFDRRTTGVDQFRELTYETHLRRGRVFLDIVINHTGWGSRQQEEHPEWFVRDHTGTFVSPGAWGNTWEDLVELNHGNPASWDALAEMFLVWCRRGVDGFRCDAGYKVPMHAWRYITARVREEFPDAVFLLEGLGGSWAATESLLTEGGMQWAYSELFQNYSGGEVAWYLDYALEQNRRVGLYAHYSETHDNNRLAQRGRVWSLLRNRLSALTSASGAYGFTCGVEWLAAEKISVHGNSGMAWGNPENIVPEIAALNRLLAEHPCFFDDAKVTRLSAKDSAAYALLRESQEGLDRVLVLVNTDSESAQQFRLAGEALRGSGILKVDLLGQALPRIESMDGGLFLFHLPAGATFCLAETREPRGLHGHKYRQARACASFGFRALANVFQVEQLGNFDWRGLAELVTKDPCAFLGALRHLPGQIANSNIAAATQQVAGRVRFPHVIVWRPSDARRVTMVPPGHWLLVEDSDRFRVALHVPGRPLAIREESIGTQSCHAACFPPASFNGMVSLEMERYGSGPQQLNAGIQFLPSIEPVSCDGELQHPEAPVDQARINAGIVLLTNGRGGMARIGVNLGQIQSKYDCVLGANLHASVPVDRHILVKRVRMWSVADGFITPLDEQNLIEFQAGPPARWRFVANAGDGRTVEIHLEADMMEDRNTTVLRLHRPPTAPSLGRDLPEDRSVRLTVRVDIEDRNFHWETKRNEGADHHFATSVRDLQGRAGFEFNPAPDRRLCVTADVGRYHHEAEWCENIGHPVEGSRGQTSSGDAYSPGWFNLPISREKPVTMVLCADSQEPTAGELALFDANRRAMVALSVSRAGLSENDRFGQRLAAALQAFVVRRDSGKTVIAGYPWFLDWGRDSLISARGLLAAGMIEEVRQLLLTFGKFEKDGTLPNSIHGEDASNRDTTDASLWFGIVCEDFVELTRESLDSVKVGAVGRTLVDVLVGIAEGYLRGTPNGIRVDAASGLVWSPSHFTWMDTNYPAGTPRTGYPIEIQVLWIRLLRQLANLGVSRVGVSWRELEELAMRSLVEHFWMEDKGYLSDVLLSENGEPASRALRDDALRSNGLFAVSLGLLSGERARRLVEVSLRHLVVPGALRTLAPLPVAVPLPIRGAHGLLNDPGNPYWGHYEGDEDTRRKPAYHNGTAWTWTFPSCCEALARAWDRHPDALAVAKSYLRSMELLLDSGCIGHLPEIVDGDAPHTQRGCDAQAWSVAEALRVWKLLNRTAQ